MLRDITLGQYFPGKSFVHRLDPRMKLVLTLCFIVLVFLPQNWWGILLVVAFMAATVALSGQRVDGEMLRCATALCARVRRVVVDADGGERLALRLREEFGLPVLPMEHPAQLELCFSPGKTGHRAPRLELFGRKPELDGLKLVAPGLAQEDRCALDVMTLLWERGKMPDGGIKINRN